MKENRIQEVAVIGAGAVGSFFLTGLTASCDVSVYAVASGERKERLQKEGFSINGTRHSVEVRTPEEAQSADLILICVKYGALAQVLTDLKKMVREETILLCPMNGVDTEEIIGSSIGKEHLLHSFMVIAAERTGRDIIYNDGVKPCVHYGRAAEYGTQKDLQAVTDLFARCAIVCKLDEQIITAMWNKFALNISTNIAQAIVGCNYGAYKTSPYMNALGQKLCDEVLAVADACGVVCTFDNQRALRTIGTSNAARFSTLQDLMAGRHTEVDMFCGAVMRMGKEHGVPTPFNEFAFLTIKAIEEKNDGTITL